MSKNRKPQPRWHYREEGPLCEVGQHSACPSVGDPFDDGEPEARAVWVCSCTCHIRASTGEKHSRIYHLKR